MHSRRFACLLLGVWFGGELLLAWMGTLSLRSVDRLQSDPNPAATLHVKEAGAAGARLLRYQAAEDMRGLLYDWGLAEMGLGAFLLLFLLFGTEEGKVTLLVALVMLGLMLLQRLMFVPEMAALGRMLDFAPGKAFGAERAKLGVLEDSYWGIELVKWGTGALLAVRLMVRSRGRSRNSRKQIDLVDEANYRHIDR